MDDFREIELTSEGQNAIKEGYVSVYDEMNAGSKAVEEHTNVKPPTDGVHAMAIVIALADIAAELRGLRADIQCLGACSDEE